MLQRLLPLVLLSATLVVPAEAACCAGFGGCPTAAAGASDCCAAAVDDPAAQRCCDGGDSSELRFTGAKSQHFKAVATPAAAPSAGRMIAAETDIGLNGGFPAPPLSPKPLYTLHSILLI